MVCSPWCEFLFWLESMCPYAKTSWKICEVNTNTLAKKKAQRVYDSLFSHGQNSKYSFIRHVFPCMCQQIQCQQLVWQENVWKGLGLSFTSKKIRKLEWCNQKKKYCNNPHCFFQEGIGNRLWWRDMSSASSS